MSEDKKKMTGLRVSMSNNELKELADKYIMRIAEILESKKEGGVREMMKELMAIGYAVGVIGRGTTHVGVIGFPALLNGIIFSMIDFGWKEKMQYAYWDEKGNLYTSDDTYEVRKKSKE